MMKKAAIFVMIIFTTLSCKTIEDMNGNYKVTIVGDNNYGEYDITLNIETDGTVNRISGKSACNQYSGEFNFQGTSIEIGPLMGTKMYCRELDKIERDYTAHLTKSVQVKPTEDGLELFDESGTLTIKAIKIK